MQTFYTKLFMSQLFFLAVLLFMPTNVKGNKGALRSMANVMPNNVHTPFSIPDLPEGVSYYELPVFQKTIYQQESFSYY